MFGVSVLTAVVYISYVNELRRGGMAANDAIRDGAIVKLRPIMMTALVAAFGLVPAPRLQPASARIRSAPSRW
ncbi:MAG TPA: efflux RND transporter permease subunit [Rhizomicrobium sp.]|nr:efflux RND transporter permease subunit [Rhizomicrobium sp.]